MIFVYAKFNIAARNSETIIVLSFFLIFFFRKFQPFRFKVCLYRTQPRLGGVREGMVEIKQTKVVHTEHDRGTRL